MSYIVAPVTDIHSGSKVAVCPPRINFEAGTYTANKWQAWLWIHWLEYWEYVKFKRGKGRKKKKLAVIILGEIGEGDHHGSLQNFVPNNTTLQKRVALAVLEPMLSLNPDVIYVRSGTEAHSGKSGQFDEMIAEDIGAELHKESGRYAPNMGDVYIEDVLFDLEHHGKTGNLMWTKANGANQLAHTISYSRLRRYRLLKEPIPDIALRGHKHTYVDTYKNAEVRLIALNSWKAEDNFFHRIAIGHPPEYGSVIIDIDGKKYEVDDTLAKMMMPRDKPQRAPE